MTKYRSFERDVRPPSVLLPPNACDTHFHVFGSRSDYPVLPGIEHDMPDATVEAALKLHKSLGISRGVIIATLANGTNHQVVLDALAVAGPNYRGCALASVLTETSDSYIARLEAAGVRGVRFNLLKMLGSQPSAAAISRAIDRCRELGWYCKVQPDYHVPLESLVPFEDACIPVIIDHLGRATPEQGLDGPIISKMLEFLKRGNFWLLLSNGYKVSRKPPLWDDVVPIVRRYIDVASDRLLWASDWPHTFHTEAPPNDGDLLEFLIRATDESERRRILVDNPAVAFDFNHN
jgi:predicted TIM-barrel fold metal-dependent hydrolase